jgi:hypothetical protein
VKEIRNLYSIHKIASPIVLPRSDAHEIIAQQDQALKVCEISTSSGPVKDNINCFNPERNHKCQILSRSVGSMEGDPTSDPVTEAPINNATDNDESSVNVNSLPRTESRCKEETSMGNDSQKADYVKKPPSLNDKSQEDVITSKSTRTKNNPSITNQEFFMVKEQLKIDSQSERSVSGESVNTNNVGELLTPIGTKGCSVNTPVISNININMNNSSSQQTSNPISLTITKT